MNLNEFFYYLMVYGFVCLFFSILWVGLMFLANIREANRKIEAAKEDGFFNGNNKRKGDRYA